MAYAEWVKTTFDINEETIFGSQTPFYFSMSVLDIYTTLAAGAELQICRNGFCLSGAASGIYEQPEDQYYLLGADGIVHRGKLESAGLCIP